MGGRWHDYVERVPHSVYGRLDNGGSCNVYCCLLTGDSMTIILIIAVFFEGVAVGIYIGYSMGYKAGEELGFNSKGA